ncbi:MAG: hypothetical protein K0R65_2662 [Crocinitomicaceae bacterium]|jgi:hypothetical protein|nr:hypothetical protein [Crocinitomicaceae bacterium]
MKDPLEIIGKIKQVETPPFLYSRILQQIENSALNKVSRPLAWSLGSACVALCIFSLVISFKARQTDTASDLGQGMNLIPENSLYYE